MILWNVLYLTITMTTNCQEDDTNSKLSEKMPAKSWFLMVLRLLLICRIPIWFPLILVATAASLPVFGASPAAVAGRTNLRNINSNAKTRQHVLFPKCARSYVLHGWKLFFLAVMICIYIKNWTTDIRSLAFSLARQTQVISSFTCITKYGQWTRHQIKKAG